MATSISALASGFQIWLFALGGRYFVLGVMIKASSKARIIRTKVRTISSKAEVIHSTSKTLCSNSKTNVEIQVAILGFHSIHLLWNVVLKVCGMKENKTVNKSWQVFAEYSVVCWSWGKSDRCQINQQSCVVHWIMLWLRTGVTYTHFWVKAASNTRHKNYWLIEGWETDQLADKGYFSNSKMKNILISFRKVFSVLRLHDKQWEIYLGNQLGLSESQYNLFLMQWNHLLFPMSWMQLHRSRRRIAGKYNFSHNCEQNRIIQSHPFWWTSLISFEQTTRNELRKLPGVY